MEQLDLKTLSLAILQIAEEKGIPEEKVIEVIETALAAAYKKDYGKKEEKYRSDNTTTGDRTHERLVGGGGQQQQEGGYYNSV